MQLASQRLLGPVQAYFLCMVCMVPALTITDLPSGPCLSDPSQVNTMHGTRTKIALVSYMGINTKKYYDEGQSGNRAILWISQPFHSFKSAIMAPSRFPQPPEVYKDSARDSALCLSGQETIR